MVRIRVLLAAALLTGCGGGGSSDLPIPSAGDDSAALTVLVGDAPIDEFDEAVMTVSEIRLLMDDGQEQTILDQLTDVDLLALRNVTEVLLVEEITVGRVNKIRLVVSDFVLRRFDGDVLVAEERPRLLANGKVDLNPQGPVDVQAGDELILEIDFDLARSVKLVETGNGELLFRPVVFVELVTELDDGALARLSGIVQGQQGAFDLCDLERSSDEDSRSDIDECVDMRTVDASTVGVGTEGTIVDDVPETNDPATVFGFVRLDDAAERVLDARLIALGPHSTWDTVEGTVTGTPAADGFEVTTDGSGTVVTVNVSDRSLAFGDDGAAVDDLVAALAGSAQVEVFGLADGTGASIDALVLLIDDDTAEPLLDGTVVDVLDATFSVDDDGLVSCVAFDADTRFVSVTSEDGAVLSAETDSSVLAVDAKVEVFGTAGADCADAETVVVEAIDA